MHILLINIPSRKGMGGKFLPLGLLYVGEILERVGHTVTLYDPYLDDLEMKQFDSGDFSRVDRIIQEFKPEIIGFGGIGSSYTRTKKISNYLFMQYPKILQIAGGPLSSIYKLILTQTRITVVFHGEADITLPEFLDKFQNNLEWFTVPGISFMMDGQVRRNPPAEQISDLDIIPLPAYHLINPDDYCEDLNRLMNYYKENLEHSIFQELEKKIRTKKKIFPIITSRGCTNRCSFCYRHMRGYRQHSVPYVIEHMKMLQRQYQIDFFEICDEMFNFRREWIITFCETIERENLNISYRILGARVDRVDRQLLELLYKTGCVEINYGQESGSDLILKEYKKGTTVKQNIEITRLSKEIGMVCPVQIVIGSPGETMKTIKETINFLNTVDCRSPSINYLIPFPETPIWDYVEKKNLVPDLEAYLEDVANFGGAPLINLTNVPDRYWRSWNFIMKNEVRLTNYCKDKKYFTYLLNFIIVKCENLLFPGVPRRVIQFVKRHLIK